MAVLMFFMVTSGRIAVASGMPGGVIGMIWSKHCNFPASVASCPQMAITGTPQALPCRAITSGALPSGRRCAPLR